MDSIDHKQNIKSPLLHPTQTLQFNQEKKITGHSLQNSEINNTSMAQYRNTVKANIRVTSIDYGENDYEGTYQEARNPLLLKGLGAINIRTALKTSIRGMFKN